jgi:D-serine deaminase-like pyridoxal phosphate-dependent protein
MVRRKVDLKTPSLLLDLDVMERNILDYAEVARSCKVKLRPHAKTPKIPAICHRQIAAGAAGVCVATIDEAWTMVGAGITDVLIPYPITGPRVDEVRRLLSYAKVAVVVDTLEVATDLASAMATAGQSLPTRVKIDLGSRRFGLPPKPATLLAFVRKLEHLPGLAFDGISTYVSGEAADGSPSSIAVLGQHEGDTMVMLAETLRQRGIPVNEISVGSTATARYAAGVAGVTEIRPGTYVFNDVTMLDRGICPEAACSLTVLLSVVDRPTPDRVILDGGSKTFTFAPAPVGGGWGLVKGSDGLRIDRMTEEHSVLERPGLAKRFRLGDKVEIIPNACGETLNVFNELFALRGDLVDVCWRIPATGYSNERGQG